MTVTAIWQYQCRTICLDVISHEVTGDPMGTTGHWLEFNSIKIDVMRQAPLYYVPCHTHTHTHIQYQSGILPSLLPLKPVLQWQVMGKNWKVLTKLQFSPIQSRSTPSPMLFCVVCCVWLRSALMQIYICFNKLTIFLHFIHSWGWIKCQKRELHTRKRSEMKFPFCCGCLKKVTVVSSLHIVSLFLLLTSHFWYSK